MEEKINSLKWVVLIWSFNEDKIEEYNIFDNSNIVTFLKSSINKEYNLEDFTYELDKELRQTFWSKCEYEALIGGLFTRDTSRYKKIDVYDQLRPNILLLSKYIYTTLGMGKYNDKK